MVECPFQCGKLVKVEVCLECQHHAKHGKTYVDCGWRASWERKYGKVEIEEVK